MRYTHVYIILIFLLCIPFSSCTTGQDTASEEALLDSARTEMLVNMDYRKAESIYKNLISRTRNNLIRLKADEGMMHLCQIRSLNKTFYDYKLDAQKILDEYKTVARHIDAHNDSLIQEARKEFYRISAVYYITLRDIEHTYEMLDSLHNQTLGKKEFLAIYLGNQSLYYKSLKKVWIAETLTEEGLYDQALDSLALALHMVNLHHQKYSFSGISDTLSIYKETPSDTLSVEMRWIQNPNFVTIPDWMATIREQLSITFGAMGNKRASDYNHNIYFDILDATRQDQQLEQQLDSLESHEKRLYIMLFSASIIALLLVLLGIRISRRGRQQSLLQQKALKLEISRNISELLPRWLEKNGGSISQIQDEMEYADDERRAAEMKADENKRGYVEKATSVSIANGIIPFLDRAIHEVDSDNCNTAYLAELIDKINDYNDVLGHYVKIRQGSVSLHLESFPLSSLFAVVQKAQKIYKSEGLTLNVRPTNAIVKADKALTLFMINTLMDNARKFTPKGGRIDVYAESTEEYVEISVSDTGYGMTENDTREVITSHKGHGFGLMNCRGIIEKYKKTNRIFSVCHFGVESKMGEGSRFFFRLPGKLMTILLLFVSTLSFAQSSHMTDSGKSASDVSAGVRQAREYADSVYFCNTTGQYTRAIEFGDSVLSALNLHYIASTHRTESLLKLESELSDMPEIKWWNDGFDTDYDVIISVRNEIAIAALATNRKHLYRYNCDVFTRLYQCITRDQSKADTIRRMERTNNNKVLILNLLVMAILMTVLLYAMFFYRKYMLPLFNLRVVNSLSDTLLNTPAEKILKTVRNVINDIIVIDNMQVLPPGTSVVDTQNYTLVFPLTVTDDDKVHNLGLLSLHSRQLASQKSYHPLIKAIADHLAIALYCSSTKIEELRQQLELKQDEQYRAESYRNRIHVQNMILDNCLSAIKHETMYYPNKIKTMLQTKGEIDREGISELLHYYKDIFITLSMCAIKQLEPSAFRRQTLSVSDISRILDDIRLPNESNGIKIHADINVPSDTLFIADAVMLQYMLNTLITANHQPAEINIEITSDSRMLQFSLRDSRKKWNAEQTTELFYADNIVYHPDTDQLEGAEYILSKQVIREHDNHCGMRVCRIYAVVPDKLIFTLPLRIEKTTGNHQESEHNK